MSRRARILTLALGALFVLATGATAWLMTRRAALGDRDYVESRVGDVRLIYQPAYARFGGGRSGGRLDTLDLAATFPELKPAGDAATPLAQADGAGKGPALVFLSIVRPERGVDPADRVSLLYARFLEADVVETDDGLLKRNFQPGSPYASEDLYFAPPEGRVFAARCTRPTIPPDGLPETCIASFRLGEIDVDLRFSPKLLPDWERLSDGTRALVQSMLAR